ncbi:Ig-like domain-containing protein [Pelagihabitans pacificus]|nr:Ig-like domain-containing protein [Pelagihabitans pacificus]
MVSALWQCAKRGSPTGGPKDEAPPILLRSDPDNMTVNFKTNKIKLYFDEYVKLENLQEQLIVSPPLKYLPEITPQGGTGKVVEVTIKDTLKENTTYTFNFGQSIVDNNEGNPYPFLTYVFSTGDFIDSLTLNGVVKDALNKKADDFISVMLYEIDSMYTDSTVFQRPPNYITNTLDSAIIFKISNIKEGRYALFALKDEAKNNVFDQNTDKIGFVEDTISIPTDSTYLLNLFREIPDYNLSVPSFAASNKIIFGYYGDGKEVKIEPMSALPDTVRTKVLRERDKDTLNFWFTPFETDSILFTVTNEAYQRIDTFNVKTRKVAIDSLVLNPNFRGTYNFNDSFHIAANIPLTSIDSTQIQVIDKDSIPVPFQVDLDSIENKVDFDFEVEPNQTYNIELLPGAITDFFEGTNDSLLYSLSTKSPADYANLTVNLEGAVTYPLILQLTNEQGETQIEQYAEQPRAFQFNNIEPGIYIVRVIFDTNQNRKWDTGNFLQRLQPEKVSYYPKPIELRANWEMIETFTLIE